MNPKQYLLYFLLLPILHSRASNGYIYLADTTKLFFGSNNEIYSPDKKQLLYFQKGNIFFSGSTDERQNIYLMTTSMNSSTDASNLLYEKDNREATFSFSSYKFYSGKTESEVDRGRREVLHIEKSKKWLAFYSSINDTLLAYYNDDSLPASTAILVAYTLIKKYELEKKLLEQISSIPLRVNSYVTIKPYWGNPIDNEWMWDGKVLRPRWNVDPRLAWTYDGQTIKPQYGNNIYAQFSWDGEILKPVWRTNRAEEWSWDGRLMKPVWDTDWANQYTIEDGVVKPWSNVHTEREWHLDGDMPIPLIILIISGIAKTY